MFYDEYFTRIEETSNFNKNLYNKKIEGYGKNEKDKNLFEDCFSNHVDFDNPLVDKLILNNSDNTRYIERDMLSSYFINKIYKVPKILKYETNQEVDYENFAKNISESSYSKIYSNDFSLGSNRLRFIVGEVGEGKSALTKKVLSTIEQNKKSYCSEYDIYNIYINFEDLYNYGNKPILLKDDFPKQLHSTIKEKMKKHIDLSSVLNSSCVDTEPLLALKMLFETLKQNNIRLILYLDNIDFYHYYYSKYSYFNEYDEKQNEAINNNILWLYSFLTKKAFLGDQGLNILLSVRNYVYEDIVLKSNGTDTEINTTKAYKIKLVDESEVIYSRVQLLESAFKLIKKENNTSDLNEFIAELKTEIFFKSMNNLNIEEHSPTKTIYLIGQHGYRTLVQFFSSLNIAYLDFELMDRFFKKQVSSLVLLYFTNIYKRYSQQKEHFPNLFLNDCIISYKDEFQNAHQSHKHTYWLKYFILKIIVKNPNIKVQKILDIFCDIGKYDEHLVRHVIGSLETANEFRCIEYDPDASSNNINHRKLKPTNRGKYLISTTNNIEECFDIGYLQVIIEDKWLSVPNFIVKEFYNYSLDYTHLYTTGTFYIDKSIEHTTQKAKSILIFLKILKESYQAEIQINKNNLHSYLENNELIPNLDKISDSIIESTEGVIKAFKRQRDLYKVENLKKYKKTLDYSDKYLMFFKEYHNDLDEKSKVR